jgi:hypothetical protein
VLAAAPSFVYESYKERHDESYVRDDDDQHAGGDQGAPPYSIELETPVLPNSLARASPDKKTGSYTFKENQPTEMKQNFANV